MEGGRENIYTKNDAITQKIEDTISHKKGVSYMPETHAMDDINGDTDYDIIFFTQTPASLNWSIQRTVDEDLVLSEWLC